VANDENRISAYCVVCGWYECELGGRVSPPERSTSKLAQWILMRFDTACLGRRNIAPALADFGFIVLKCGTSFLTLALDGGEWSASRPGHFTPSERAPATN
jgi:hypothetical protein